MSHFRRSAPLLLAVSAALAIPATASATHDFSFAPQANYDLPPGPPTAINIGDADGDGTEDIIVTSPTTNTITIDHLNGSTMEQEKVTAPFFQSQATGPTSVVTLQEDGKSSYALGMTNPSALLGDVDGSVAFGPTLPLASPPMTMAVGDFDEDGRSDIVTASNTSLNPQYALTIALQTKPGLFDTSRPGSNGTQPNVVAAPAGTYSSLSLDPVTPDAPGGALRATPRATTRATTTCFNQSVPSNPEGITAPNPSSIAVGDIDGDGHQDLYISSFYGLGGTSDWILWGNGLGCFPSGTANPGINSKYAQLSDTDGDGKLDLLATPYNCTGQYVFPDACTNFIGVFQSQKQKDGTIVFNTVGEDNLYPDEADTPQQWVVKDFDNDRHPDVFAAGFRHVDVGTSGYGSVMPNLKLGDSWGDFGGKQQIMSDSSKADGPIGAAAGDLNSDGYPDAVTLNLNSNTISVMLNETASNAVVSDATTTMAPAPDPETTAAKTARAAAARSGGKRTVPVTITCRRGLRGIGCRGTLTVHRLKGAAKLAPALRGGARLARIRYDLKPGKHTLRVPVTGALRQRLAGHSSTKLLFATKTAQRPGHDASHNARIVTVRGA